MKSFFLCILLMVRVRDDQKICAIKREAIRMIVTEGFDGLSMHKLAKAANVSPATIYIYFRDREDLISQISIEEKMLMFEATLADFNPEVDFEVGFKQQWINRANYFMKHPQKMLFLEQIRYSRFDEGVKLNAYQDFIDKMKTFINNAVEKGQLKPLPLEMFWSLAFAPLYQLLKFHINGKGMHQKPFELTEEYMENALSLIIKALVPDRKKDERKD